MHKEDQLYKEYLAILKEELIPAMGCTEPIALAYAASKAKEVLGELPDKVVVEASGSIIKNVKSVIVPNTNQLKGISAAVAAGIVAGNCDRELEVISEVDEQKKQEIVEYLRNTFFEEKFLDEGNVFDLIVTLYKDKDYSKVRISHYHTNIVLIERNGEVIVFKIENRYFTNERMLKNFPNLRVKDKDGNTKLNINGYIGKENIDVTEQKDDLKIKVVETDVYMDFQTYTFEITNNSDKTVLLNDPNIDDTMYLEDKSGVKYQAYTHEISSSELKITSKETKKLTIKYYSKYGSNKTIKNILFARIILDYGAYSNYQNIGYYNNYGAIQIKL